MPLALSIPRSEVKTVAMMGTLVARIAQERVMAGGSLYARMCRAGDPSVPILATFPLPLYTMTAALAQHATRLGALAVERPCAALLFDHFLELSPQKHVWEEHPADRLRQHDRHVRTAARPLLRAYAQVALQHSERQLAALATAPPQDTSQSYASEQSRRLLLVKRIVLAMQVRVSAWCCLLLHGVVWSRAALGSVRIALD